MGAKIVVSKLTKRYGPNLAVDALSFEVEAGTIFGLLGPNGAGKTSVLECIAGLRRPDGGTITVGGIDVVHDSAQARERLGVALQDTALPDRITPREALRLFGAFYPGAVPAEQMLARFSLAAQADCAYETLSAGQKQRVALALAFVHAPAVLLLDEPTAGLDPRARRELHREILRLRDEGRTLLLTTHLLEEAHQLCDQLVILRAGRAVASGCPDDVIARGARRSTVTLRAARPVSATDLATLPDTTPATVDGEEMSFETTRVGPAVAALVHLLSVQGNSLLDLDVRRPTLEDTFIEATAPDLPPP